MLLIKYQNDVIDVVLVFEIIEVRQRYVLLLLPPYEINNLNFLSVKVL